LAALSLSLKNLRLFLFYKSLVICVVVYHKGCRFAFAIQGNYYLKWKRLITESACVKSLPAMRANTQITLAAYLQSINNQGNKQYSVSKSLVLYCNALIIIIYGQRI